MSRPSRDPAFPNSSMDRNRAIAEERRKGRGVRDIAAEFGLTDQAIRYICRRVDKYEALNQEGSYLSTRARNVIRDNTGIDPDTFSKEAAERLSKLSRREMLKWNNCGKNTVTEIEAWLATKGFAVRDFLWVSYRDTISV